MKKMMIVLMTLLCLAAGTAAADVSNEVIVGLEGDSTAEAMDSTGADVTDKIDTTNSLFTVQYMRFFSPLREDDKPIELRRFYQHPSTLSAALVFFGSTDKNNIFPGFESDEKTSGSMLVLSGEYFLPTNTGLFLSLGAGGGTVEETIGGTAQPEIDLELGRIELGVRQYIVPEVEVHLRYEGETIESTPSGLPTDEDEKAVTFLGVRGVIKDMIGLMLEVGGGKRELNAGGSTSKFDVAAASFEIAGYIGKQFSVRLAAEAESQDLEGMAAGFEHTRTTARSTLAAKYWFSERLGLELPLYSEMVENKTVFPGGEFKDRITNSGIGLYAAMRF
jgi:hypothetical protein